MAVRNQPTAGAFGECLPPCGEDSRAGDREENECVELRRPAHAQQVRACHAAGNRNGWGPVLHASARNGGRSFLIRAIWITSSGRRSCPVSSLTSSPTTRDRRRSRQQATGSIQRTLARVASETRGGGAKRAHRQPSGDAPFCPSLWVASSSSATAIQQVFDAPAPAVRSGLR